MIEVQVSVVVVRDVEVTVWVEVTEHILEVAKITLVNGHALS